MGSILGVSFGSKIFITFSPLLRRFILIFKLDQESMARLGLVLCIHLIVQAFQTYIANWDEVKFDKPNFKNNYHKTSKLKSIFPRVASMYLPDGHILHTYNRS